MKSYLQKETDRAPAASKHFHKSGKVKWFVTTGISCISIAVALFTLSLTQESMHILHDQDAIKHSQEACAQVMGLDKAGALELEHDDEKYTKAMIEDRFFDALDICNHLEHAPTAYDLKKRGEAYFMLEQYESALQDYQASLKLRLRSADEFDHSITDLSAEYNSRGDAYFKLGAFKDATRDYRVALATCHYPPNLIGAVMVGSAEIFNSVGLYKLSADFMRGATEHLSTQSQFNLVAI